MAQTIAGAAAIAANKAGVTLPHYLREVAAGRKWCYLCREFHDRAAFGADATRFDGLDAACKVARNQRSRTRYTPKVRKRGRVFVQPRDGDKLQARGRVNYLVVIGILPHPDVMPCVDCGHMRGTDDRRHQYDHHQGYSAEHHATVEAVCTACHTKREKSAAPTAAWQGSGSDENQD